MVSYPVYIGWDEREQEAFKVAAASLRGTASIHLDVHQLDAEDLFQRRLLWRPITRGVRQVKDHLSDAPQATEFATSRFLVPTLARTGWALFVDCDVVFLGDVAELFALADPRYAVMVVKHPALTTTGLKMDGQEQTSYPRKNWSSVMLWNCDHVANERLDLGMVNWWPGALLHRFCWLRDEEIGELPPAWNWLVNVRERPQEARLAHFTLGGPWLPGWTPQPNDEVWTDARERYAANHRAGL